MLIQQIQTKWRTLNNKISTKNIYGETCGKIEIGKHMGVIMYNV